MTYTSDEGRRELLEATAEAAETIGRALAALGEAYELLDDDAADRLEAQLFGPLQAAYGRARRGHAEFAARHRLAPHAFAAGTAARAHGSTDATSYMEQALEAAEHADDILSELQDSLLPVEVGDPELRASIADVRTRLGDIPPRAHELLRTLGR
ncbi:MAG TPA: hypothetical protein VFV85_00290 [Conexibacter sp.]|nr:hypothetical protein [Conexibacter sp.]